MPAIRRLAIVVSLIVAASCASTHLDRSWSAPGLRQVPFRNVLAIAITANHDQRVAIEDAMVDRMRGNAEGIAAEASYKTLSDEDVQNADRFREVLAKSGFDAAVLMRVSNTKERDAWLPGYNAVAPMYYRTIWGYYDYWRPLVYQQGYLANDRSVHVETVIYEVPEGDLIYAAMSDALNPTSASDLVKQVGDRVAKDLREKGLLVTRPRS